MATATMPASSFLPWIRSFLASMDIPLKQWNKYIDPASGFHLSELIEDSKGIIQEQIHRLKVRQKKLEIADRGLKDNEKYEYVPGFYERRIPARNVLCYPLNEPESPVDFHKKLSILLKLHRNTGCQPIIPPDSLWTIRRKSSRFLLTWKFMKASTDIRFSGIFLSIHIHVYERNQNQSFMWSIRSLDILENILMRQ